LISSEVRNSDLVIRDEDLVLNGGLLPLKASLLISYLFLAAKIIILNDLSKKLNSPAPKGGFRDGESPL
jgi:hypothetical protein